MMMMMMWVACLFVLRRMAIISGTRTGCGRSREKRRRQRRHRRPRLRTLYRLLQVIEYCLRSSKQKMPRMWPATAFRPGMYTWIKYFLAASHLAGSMKRMDDSTGWPTCGQTSLCAVGVHSEGGRPMGGGLIHVRRGGGEGERQRRVLAVDGCRTYFKPKHRPPPRHALDAGAGRARQDGDRRAQEERKHEGGAHGCSRTLGVGWGMRARGG